MAEIGTSLDALHHIAIKVDNIAEAIQWYQEQFRCEIAYQDATWGLLKFRNIYVALVLPEQHPPHLGFSTPKAAEFGELKLHRDKTKSVYTSDPFGNVLEMLDAQSIVDAGMEV